MKTGIQLISEERTRQVSEEGFNAEHDDGHDLEEMARAAAVYALPAHYTDMEIWDETLEDKLWPWPGEFKPDRSRVRNLVKAGALIAAEIDRLQRAKR